MYHNHAEKDIQRRPGHAGLVIFLFALSLRLIHIWCVSDTPFFTSPILDAEVYDQRAWNIATGAGYSNDAFFQAPLYSYLLAAIYKIFGHNYLVPRLIQALLGALTAWMIFLLGCRIYSRKIGIIAGIIASVYAPLIHYSAQLLIPTLYVFLVTLFLITFHRLLDKQGRWDFFLTGLIIGIAALARPNILIFLPIALAWMLFYLKSRGKNVALFLLGIFLTVMPVSLRNYIVADDLVVISSQSGVNFYMGNNRFANGYSGWVPGTSKDWWGEGYRQTINIAEQAAGHPLKASSVSQYWWGRAFTEISQYPLQWGGLLLQKTRYLLTGHELSDTEDIYFHRRFSGVLWLLLWEKLVSFPFGLILPLALLGLALSTDRKRQLHLIFFQLSYAAGIILFMVTARYRLPLVPVLCIWAAVGISEPIRLIKERKISRYALTFIGFLILLIFVNINPVKGRRSAGFDGLFNLGSKYLENGQYDQALSAFREAVYLDSSSGRPVNGCGMVLLKMGRTQEAKDEFSRAILLTPSLLQARNNLGRILQGEGGLEAAVKQFKYVITVDSSNVFAHRGLADVLLQLGEFSSAEKHYAIAYSLGTDDRQLMSRWAQTLVQQHKFTEALKVNSELLLREPTNVRVHHNQARIYMAVDSTERAIEELEIVLRLSPENAEAQEQLKKLRR
ncbi:hypothetical protein CEE37_06475 [candidate division LCP-89 bacterium B3_LCP]|uniref:Glycosyltransferase RgtA/B/C/D-like domain-containing protein n=1 Tax=candidate division LCP-89 bacterium B3_LCP TaxID=2012998 RepID=A0A532V062_UNCL8|nr:MAG: hypothetical protein CEE37_06475 [candidate division LCP-89 bacterium B3_LCP]